MNLAGGNSNSGGFSVWTGSNMNFNFCTFAGNVAAYGSALSVGGGSYADLHGSIVWGNQGQNSLAAVQWDNNGSSLYLRRVLFKVDQMELLQIHYHMYNSLM